MENERELHRPKYRSRQRRSVSKIKLKEKITPKCPECGGSLIFEGGCNTCKDCGWSKCD